MSTEFETIRSELGELKICIKELTKTVTDNMVRQSREIGVLQQWQSEVNNKLAKCESDRAEIRIDLQRMAVTLESLTNKQETAFKRIDEVRDENKADEARLKKIESTLDRQKGSAKTMFVCYSVLCLIITGLGVYASFIKG